MGWSMDALWSKYGATADMWTACTGVGLLIIDVVLPVPSSMIMIGLGSVFGVVGGACLSILGGMGASLAAFTMGRLAQRRVQNWIGHRDYHRCQTLLNRWGLVAIIVSRPLPILSEAVALVAGASSMGWTKLMIGSILGLVPASVFYAITGAGIAQLESTGTMIGLTAILGAGAWFVGRRVEENIP